MSDNESAPVVVGRNVARLRRMKGWSQAQLAIELAPKLGRAPWSRQAVNMGEQGKRSWTATEVAAVAGLFGVSPGALFEPSNCVTCDGEPPAGFACMECGASAKREIPDAQFNNGGLLRPAWGRRANRTDRPERVLSYDDARRLPGEGES